MKKVLNVKDSSNAHQRKLRVDKKVYIAPKSAHSYPSSSTWRMSTDIKKKKYWNCAFSARTPITSK
jgi:hypothetical protein